ncbi:MAG: glycosyltransferase family 4 protein [Chloroflexota bacterium]
MPKLIKMRPTAVISAEFSVPSMLALVYCRLFGASFISWSENTLQQEQHASNMQRRVRRLLIKNASACVGTSSGARDKYIHYGCQPEAAFVAIQTVDVSFFMRGAERMRQEQNQDAPATILYTGALSERKGVRYLIQAFAQLAKSHPCRLVLVGQGPLEQEFKQQVSRWGLQEQVHFSGFLEGDALVQRYAEATLFVLPTLEDTFGLVVNEAMACQLPIICSPFAGAAQDLVREGENGYIVDPQQQAALVQRMEEIITDPALQKQMGRASREIIGEYGMETAVQGFIQAIHYATGEKE